MAALADHSLRDLLNQVAAQRPAPGGGCSAAWACALAAGLVEMAAAFTLARPRYAGVHRRMLDVRREAGGLRRRVVDLAERDGDAYEPVLAALRLPAHHPRRPGQLDAARSRAAETPLDTAEAAAQVAELAAEAVRTGNVNLQGDAVTGALLAEAACRSAARLVEINLAGRPEDPRLERAAAAVRRAGSARAEVLDEREEERR